MGSSWRPDRTLAVAALGLVLIASAGCYWSRYDQLARTHVDLLLAMAAKIDDVVRREGAAPATLAEYRYPLERARDFARIAGRRFEGRTSLVALRDLCDAYERLLLVVERMRGAADPAGESAALTTSLATLRTDAAEVIAALDQEKRR
jgi:hypothetical protein